MDFLNYRGEAEKMRDGTNSAANQADEKSKAENNTKACSRCESVPDGKSVPNPHQKRKRSVRFKAEGNSCGGI